MTNEVPTGPGLGVKLNDNALAGTEKGINRKRCQELCPLFGEKKVPGTFPCQTH
jgi:hypothetical protein